MSKIYFVRHGESEWNVADKICGQTDIPLTQRGHEQAVMTGESFVARKIKADMILYSPLLRAADTAKHISDITGIPVYGKEHHHVIHMSFMKPKKDLYKDLAAVNPCFSSHKEYTIFLMS